MRPAQRTRVARTKGFVLVLRLHTTPGICFSPSTVHIHPLQKGFIDKNTKLFQKWNGPPKSGALAVHLATMALAFTSMINRFYSYDTSVINSSSLYILGNEKQGDEVTEFHQQVCNRI